MSKNPHQFQIKICTEEFNRESNDNGLACQLVFTYTDKYPDTAPQVEIDDKVEFEADYEEKLLQHIQETVSLGNSFNWIDDNVSVPLQINENLGTEMIFSLVSSAQEWLNVKWDEHKKELENKEMEKVKAFEEAEQVNIPSAASFIFILLDNWHRPHDIDVYFAEKIRRYTRDGGNIFNVAQ